MCENAVLETGGVYMMRVKTEASAVRANGVLEKAEANRNRTPGLHRIHIAHRIGDPRDGLDSAFARPACAARVVPRPSRTRGVLPGRSP